MVPIALAVATADVIRTVMAAHGLIAVAPLFPVPPHGSFAAIAVAAAAAVGVAAGLLAWVLTGAVYGAEDLFKKLPIHWAWWPAIGGVVIGLGGLIDPRALGVGYASIRAELAGQLALGSLATLLVVKLVIWSVGLGSGTSGGILAPLLMMGAAVGGLLAPVLPGGSPATWALLGMAGALAGVTRSPLTAIVFAFELTHDTGSLLPLLVTCSVAHLISSLVLKRSILTEKVARRGFHVVREYQVEPLEALFVREAMQRQVQTLSADDPATGLARQFSASESVRRQRLFPVVDGSGALTGVVTHSSLLPYAHGTVPGDHTGHPDGTGPERPNGPDQQPPLVRVADVVRPEPVVAYPDETLRTAADRMAENWLGALPVVDRGEPRRLVGILTEFDLLKARQRQLVEERVRQRVLRFGRSAPAQAPVTDDAGESWPVGRR
jgi:chloride channel protein, CIC family